MFNLYRLFSMLILLVLTASAVAVSPTPDQIAQFKKLPVAQQKMLASQYGMDLDQLQSLSLQSTSTINMNQPQETIQPRTLENDHKRDETEDVISVDDLDMFGYDLFAGEPMSLTPLDDLPVPNNYILGVGDELQIKVFGKKTENYNLVIDREGSIYIPELGPFQVRGLTYQQARQDISKFIKRSMIGVETSVSLGKLKTIQVFVLGLAYKPGSYVVSSLSTATQAIKAAGGIDELGSLRHIQIKRNNIIIKTIDLYDLLISGDTSSDISLKQGDVVFIPLKKKTVSIYGAVKRPAIYELKNEINIDTVLSLAGGLAAEGEQKVQVTRKTNKGLQLYDIKLNSAESNKTFSMRNGDELLVGKSSDVYHNAVTLSGAVTNPGVYQWTRNSTVSDIVKSLKLDVNKDAELQNALLVREISPDHQIKVISFNLLEAISNPKSKLDIKLQADDQIIVLNKDNGGYNQSTLDQDLQFPNMPGIKTDLSANTRNTNVNYTNNTNGINNINANSKNSDINNVNNTSNSNYGSSGNSYNNIENSNVTSSYDNDNDELEISDLDDKSIAQNNAQAFRTELLKPIIAQLKAQADYQTPVQIVDIRGAVKFPGVYPLFEDADLQTLINIAGGLKEASYLTEGELSRMKLANGKTHIDYQKINIADAMASKNNANLKLESKDRIHIFTKPEWREDYKITLSGEVKFPGEYGFNRGETLYDVIERAGGLTEYAYPEGAVFARESLRKIEQEQLKYLHQQLRQEVSSLSFRRQSSSNPVQSNSAQSAMEMVDKLGTAEAVGRMSINLDKIMAQNKEQNVNLENQDFLYIPPLRKVISVIGYVQFPTSHIFEANKSINDYIALSGGAKKQADTDRVYVIRANGSVFVPNQSFWFSREDKPLMPGDTIVMPMDTDYMDKLTTFTSATQILYQLGVAWSAISN